MSALALSTAHRAARNAASIGLADTGAGASTIKLYDAQSGTLLAVRTLANPCGAVREVDGRIDLAQAVLDDLVIATGGVSWAEWCDGTGTAISTGTVTDEAGNYTNAQGAVVAHPDGIGAFTLAGTTGTTLYAGGVVRLGNVVIG